MSFAFDVVHLLQTDSTQAEARRRLDAGRSDLGLVVVADEQCQGRGRRGRTWHTSPGRSLATTLVLPAVLGERPAALVLLMAVAGARALERCGAREVAIKWPNDLYRGERKIGGFLAERLRAAGGERLLLGWGVNLAEPRTPWPPPLDATAGHAGLEPTASLRDVVLGHFLSEVSATLAGLGGPDEQERREEFSRRSWLDGRSVEIRGGGRSQIATVRRVTGDGDVLLADGRQLLGEHVEEILPLTGTR
jgi:BirA family biotin operon repressor/biotin-[acetyl-CoA-carboxylase] ligase